jgi:hypothetical protein
MDNLGSIAIEPVAAPLANELPVPIETPPIVAEAPALYFKYLGANTKNFLIVCNYPGAEHHMDEKHLEALKSALGRKDLALDDVAILNIANYTTADVSQLTEYFKPQRLLLLGQVAVLQGWENVPLNQIDSLGGIKALYTHSFTEMLGDRDKTRAFWEQMKVL